MHISALSNGNTRAVENCVSYLIIYSLVLKRLSVSSAVIADDDTAQFLNLQAKKDLVVGNELRRLLHN